VGCALEFSAAVAICILQPLAEVRILAMAIFLSAAFMGLLLRHLLARRPAPFARAEDAGGALTVPAPASLTPPAGELTVRRIGPSAIRVVWLLLVVMDLAFFVLLRSGITPLGHAWEALCAGGAGTCAALSALIATTSESESRAAAAILLALVALASMLLRSLMFILPVAMGG
ncbi:MAG: hypothetical protein AB7S36_02330, partial [Planctomycetota bacterium]